MGTKRYAQLVVLGVSVVLGIVIIWLLRDIISLLTSIPIYIAVVGVILTAIQVFWPPTLFAGESFDIPEDFKESIRRRLPAGTGAVIAKVKGNQGGQVFHLIPNKEKILQSTNYVDWRTLIHPDNVRSAVVRQHLRGVYAAIFEGIFPGEYLIWKGYLGDDLNDPARRRGISLLHPREVEVVDFVTDMQ